MITPVPPSASDGDNDGVSDDADNCPDVSNSDQSDADGDGVGDACDEPEVADSDGDGVEDSVDNCPRKRNADQADADEDGVGDRCDRTPKPTVGGICNLASHYVQGSQKYKRLSRRQQEAVRRQISAICWQLDRCKRHLSPRDKDRLIKSQQAAVRLVASQGWLTSTEAAKLIRLISRL